MLSNQAIAQALHDIADALEIQGENRFRQAAYRRAGDTVAKLATGLDHYRQSAPLTELPAIGEGIAGIITELLDTGHSSFYDDLMARVPPGVIDMMRVPELGPKSAARLYELGITDLEALRAAASEGRLRTIKGYGAKTEARILAGIEALHQHEGRIRLVDALPVVDQLVALLLELPAVHHCSPAGSVRRGAATVSDLDLIVAADAADAVLDAVVQLPQIARVLARQADRLSAELHNGYGLELVVVAPADWGTALLLWTGSAAHREQLQALAQAHGWQLQADGLHQPDGSVLRYDSEAAVYAALELPFIAPELRNGWGELELAEQGRLPTLIEPTDLRADLHWHTDWSDGRSTLREMVAAGRALGYEYMAVADHSAYLGVTGGLDANRLGEQRREIDALNAEFEREGSAFRLLQCCEVDILPDGTLALPDDVLAALDLVVASPHVALRQPRAEATARLVRAIENPHVDIIGHPTGRILNARAGADLDMQQVIAAAAATDTVLEVNAGPERLDLDGEHVWAALQAGVRLAIDTDAHDARHLAGIGLGVLTARRGGATAAAVINTWPLEQLRDWLAHKA